MKAKKVFTRILIVILSLAVAVGVFYLAFPKQAEDVTNWVTGLFQEEEPAPEEPPIVDEQPSTDEPSDVTPPAEQPGDSSPEDPSEPTEPEPEEPVEPEQQTVSVDVYMYETNVGTIEIEQSVLEDQEALNMFWQENYHETVMTQTEERYSFSGIENVSTEDANAVKVNYYRIEGAEIQSNSGFCPIDLYEDEEMSNDYTASFILWNEELQESLEFGPVKLNELDGSVTLTDKTGTIEAEFSVVVSLVKEESGVGITTYSDSELVLVNTSLDLVFYYNGSIEI